MKKISKKTYKIYFSKKKIFSKKKQKITIVTVVYNAEKTIESTLKNVTDQSYKNFEYLVVYTPSKDKTFEVIKKYKSKINKIIINYDLGIYQSMNLGTYFASGEYINFMNSGDYFSNQNIVKEIFKSKKKEDVIYGDCEIYYKNFNRVIKAKYFINLKYGMCFSHQSCFVKTTIQKENFFKTIYTHSSDFDFFSKIYNQKKKFINLNKKLSLCMSDGIVDRKKHITLFQNLIIILDNFKGKLNFFEISKIIFNILLQIIFYYIKILIPKSIVRYLLQIKYK